MRPRKGLGRTIACDTFGATIPATNCCSFESTFLGRLHGTGIPSSHHSPIPFPIWRHLQVTLINFPGACQQQEQPRKILIRIHMLREDPARPSETES